MGVQAEEAVQHLGEQVQAPPTKACSLTVRRTSVPRTKVAKGLPGRQAWARR
jgi:hypothetical protein